MPSLRAVWRAREVFLFRVMSCDFWPINALLNSINFRESAIIGSVITNTFKHKH